ncbi:GNAT family N-acetyltransferase [Chloroflexota bacterium]
MISGNKTRLRSKSLADARNDYTWQTDSELAQLDATPPLAMSFTKYLSAYVSELRYSTLLERRFAIETLEGEHIGNCVYYGVDNTKAEAELGIIIGNRNYWDKGYGSDAVTTLVNRIFCQTNINRLYLKTLDSNMRAQRCFKKCGFITCGRMVRDGFSFEIMEMHRKQWEERQNELKEQSLFS